MNDIIHITAHDIFEEAKHRSQLKARAMPPEAAELAVITDSDDDSLRMLMEYVVTDLANRLGELDDIDQFFESITHSLDEDEDKEGWIKCKPLLKKSLVNGLLFEWFQSVGITELAQEFLALYDKAATDYRTNSTQPAFIKPKYRPYF